MGKFNTGAIITHFDQTGLCRTQDAILGYNFRRFSWLRKQMIAINYFALFKALV